MLWKKNPIKVIFWSGDSWFIEDYEVFKNIIQSNKSESKRVGNTVKYKLIIKNCSTGYKTIRAAQIEDLPLNVVFEELLLVPLNISTYNRQWLLNVVNT